MAEGKLVEELPVPCSVDSHNDTVLKSKPYLCPICTHHSLSCAGLMLHLTTEHNEHLNAVCKLCRQVFPSDKIADHVTRCKGVHACPFCRATFARPTYLQRHIVRRHHNTSLAYRPSCDVCEKTFSSTSALNIHKRVHNGDLPHSCDLCGARFNQKVHASLHVDMHHAYVELSGTPKPFSCQICGRGFLFYASLQQHKAQHSKLPQKKIECSICGSLFAFRSELERHQLSHSKKGVHQCPFCPKLFKRCNLLKAHILRHTDPELLTCQFCLRTYSSRRHLSQHICKHNANSGALNNLQCGTTSSVSSGSPPTDLVDFGALVDGCGAMTIPETFPDEVLPNLDCDQLTTTSPVISSDITLLHSILYGNGQ